MCNLFLRTARYGGGGDHKLDKEITAKCANKLKCACFCKHCLTT